MNLTDLPTPITDAHRPFPGTKSELLAERSLARDLERKLMLARMALEKLALNSALAGPFALDDSPASLELLARMKFAEENLTLTKP